MFIGKAVDDELGNQLVATMLYLDSENKKDINMYINCSGGEVNTFLGHMPTLCRPCCLSSGISIVWSLKLDGKFAMDQAASHFVNASCIPLPSFCFDRNIQMSNDASMVVYSQTNNADTRLYSLMIADPKQVENSLSIESIKSECESKHIAATLSIGTFRTLSNNTMLCSHTYSIVGTKDCKTIQTESSNIQFPPQICVKCL